MRRDGLTDANCSGGHDVEISCVGRQVVAGPLNLVDFVQWYDFRAKAHGVLESDPHPQGTVEHLYILAGELDVTTGEETRRVKQGETLRFRGDLPHKIVNVGDGEAHATMMLVLRQLGTTENSG